MAYICNDCGNRASQKFPGGKCPACDSFNIRSDRPSTRQAIREKEPRTLFELVILVLLWGLLAYGVWDRFLREEDDPAAEPADSPMTAPPLLQKALKAPPPPESDY